MIDLMKDDGSFTENDTLARIGTSCFQQLLESNVRKLSPAKWESIVSAFVQLFTTTTAYQLFDPELHAEVEPDNMDEPDGESGLTTLNREDVLTTSAIPEIRRSCPITPSHIFRPTPSPIIIQRPKTDLQANYRQMCTSTLVD